MVPSLSSKTDKLAEIFIIWAKLLLKSDNKRGYYSLYYVDPDGRHGVRKQAIHLDEQRVACIELRVTFSPWG